ncbi:MAG: hypothetical protein ACRD16_04590 [Thermoanaerobaculia bacterium]
MSPRTLARLFEDPDRTPILWAYSEDQTVVVGFRYFRRGSWVRCRFKTAIRGSLARRILSHEFPVGCVEENGRPRFVDVPAEVGAWRFEPGSFTEEAIDPPSLVWKPARRGLDVCPRCGSDAGDRAREAIPAPACAECGYAAQEDLSRSQAV